MNHELRTEIHKLLEDVPENVLQDLLRLLKEIHNQPSDKVRLYQQLRHILSEDGELLRKLAQ